jgi:hypothetical protein
VLRRERGAAVFVRYRSRIIESEPFALVVMDDQQHLDCKVAHPDACSECDNGNEKIKGESTALVGDADRCEEGRPGIKRIQPYREDSGPLNIWHKFVEVLGLLGAIQYEPRQKPVRDHMQSLKADDRAHVGVIIRYFTDVKLGYGFFDLASHFLADVLRINPRHEVQHREVNFCDVNN